MTCIDDLLAIASLPEGGPSVYLSPQTRQLAGRLGDELEQLLQKRNGFYAFESALHVLSANEASETGELNHWNSAELWRFKYGDLAEGCLFFAEDAFGGQFCIYDEGVYSFDPETAKKKWLAPSLEIWADLVLGDYDYLTGYPLAHEWQELNGPLPRGHRLVPIRPFVAGGDFEVSNLSLRNSVKAMKMRGDIASQILQLPDGAEIEIRMRK